MKYLLIDLSLDDTLDEFETEEAAVAAARKIDNDSVPYGVLKLESGSNHGEWVVLVYAGEEWRPS